MFFFCFFLKKKKKNGRHIKIEAQPRSSASGTIGGFSPSDASLKCFPTNQRRLKRKLKDYTNLHSPNGLEGLKITTGTSPGGLKTPNNPSGWETLAFAGKNQGGTKPL
jgi:hypothetical protein